MYTDRAINHLPIQLFKAFGAKAINFDSKAHDQLAKSLPCFHYQERLFCDLKIKVLSEDEQKLRIQFRNKPYRLSPQIPIECDEQNLKLIESFNTHHYVFHYDENTNSVAFFDDIEFERNDYEIIQPILRNNLCKILEQHQYNKVKSKIYQNGSNKVVIAPPPRVLMSDPTEGLRNLADGICKLVTPTQQALLIVQTANRNKLQDLKKLASTLPFNMKKLMFQIRKNKIKLDINTGEQIISLQKDCINFYKINRCKDSIGRKYKVKPQNTNNN